MGETNVGEWWPAVMACKVVLSLLGGAALLLQLFSCYINCNCSRFRVLFFLLFSSFFFFLILFYENPSIFITMFVLSQFE